MRQFGYYGGIPNLNSELEKDISQIIQWINQWTDPVFFTVAVAGTEVAIAHGIGRIPASVIPAIQETTTGQGVIYPGTTAWTKTHIYLTATAAGDYSIIARR